MKKGFLLFITFIFFYFISCKKKECQPFYEYDKIEWYSYKRNLDSIPPDLKDNAFLVGVFQGSILQKLKSQIN